MSVCFVDTETTGLDADRHEIWEVGLIVAGGDLGFDHEYGWTLPVDLSRADPIALDIGGFHQRHPQGNAVAEYQRWRYDEWALAANRAEPRLDEFARKFAELTHGKHLCGAVVSFDEERLRKLLLSQNVRPSWYYHLIDVEALAVGWLAAHHDAQRTIHVPSLPWNSNDLSRAIGVDPEKFLRHRALEDARWAKAMYEAVMG